MYWPMVCLQVELMCAGKKVDPAITLHDITDCYLDKGPNGWVRSSVGSPATGFITTVFYSRPELPTPPTPPPPPESHHGWPRAPPHARTSLASLQSSISEPSGWCRIDANLARLSSAHLTLWYVDRCSVYMPCGDSDLICCSLAFLFTWWSSCTYVVCNPV